MAQVVAHLIGNEEVGSSSLLASSVQKMVSGESGCHFFVKKSFSCREKMPAGDLKRDIPQAQRQCD